MAQFERAKVALSEQQGHSLIKLKKINIQLVTILEERKSGLVEIGQNQIFKNSREILLGDLSRF